MADINIDASINVSQVKAGTKTVVGSIEQIKQTTNSAQREIERNSARARRNFERWKSGGRRTPGRRGGGMALLELSRGVEDYSVAGMRGALNNVPGIIQSIAPSMMAISGATTIALVAVWKLGEALEKHLDKLRAAKEAKMARGLTFINPDAEIKAAKEAAEGIEDTFATLKQSVDRMQERRRSAFDRDTSIAGIQAQARMARQSVIMRGQGKTPAEIETEMMKMQHAELLRLNEARKKSITIDQDRIDRLENEAKWTQRQIEAGAEAVARFKEIRAEQNAIAIAVAKEVRARRTAAGLSTTNEEATSAIQQAQEEALARYNEEHGGEMRRLRGRVTSSEVHTERLRKLDEEIAQQKHLLAIAKDKSSVEYQRLLAQNEELNNRRELMRLDAVEAYNRFRSRMGVDSSGLLSAPGRSGLGAAEATNSLNIQRSMHLVLKSIDRSLKGKLIGVAG